jgi:hypothetical protein
MSAHGRFERSGRRTQNTRAGALAPTLAAVPISRPEELEKLDESKVFFERLHVGQGGGAHNTTIECVMEQFDRLTADQLTRGIGAPDTDRDVQHGT